MFNTHKSAEVPFHGFFDEIQHWRMIERNLLKPWFCVSLVQDDDGFESQHTMMPSDVQMLIEVLNQQVEGFIVTDVLVMMPAWMTRSDRWTLERLVELRARADIDSAPVNFCVLEDGSIYSDSGQTGGRSLSMGEINDAEILYRRKQNG